MESLNNIKDMQKAVISRANTVCKKAWSQKDLQDGKDVLFPWAYYKAALSIVPLYLAKGWEVSKSVVLSSGPRVVILNFKKPKEFW